MAAASKRTIVVGGGLAGLTAACELLERGCNVTIIEKKRNLGGTSTKATCGFAVPGSELQAALGIKDDGKDLTSDGAAAQELINNGTKDVEWLVSLAGVKDELTLRLTPGHGKTIRTLGTKEHFPGAVVTYAVIHQLEEVVKANPTRLEIVTGASVTKLITKGSQVTGVEYSKGGTTTTVEGAVLLATGGYSGDTSSDSILAQVAPQVVNFATANDERTNGDGIRLGSGVGAGTDKLNQVSIYPTAAVIPGEENEKFKIVISDAISGAGGKLIDATGSRFVDELASAQVRSDAMLKGKAPFRLVIAEKDAASVRWLCDFYASRKVMTKYSSTADLAKAMNVAPAKIKDLGTGPVFVATVTPALYSCVGGLQTGFDGPTHGQVLNTKGAPIPGLFAAGEVSSARYPGLWNVSGIPLLHCVHTGRLAGKAAAGTLGAPEQVHTIKELTRPVKAAPPAEVKKDEQKPEDMSKEELVEAYKKLLEAGPVVAAPAVEAAPAGITLAEVAKHNKKDDAWIVLFGEAMDVTKWIPIHPGGEQAIVAYLGQDATEEWQMIHKPGTVEKNLAHVTKMGKVGGGGGAAPAAGGAPAADGIPMSEVEKHNTKGDAWCIINGDVIDVTRWIPVHPGGEQAITAYLGKDATEEWNMIHKPGTVEKNLAHVKIMGKVQGGSAAAAPKPVAAGEDEAPPPEGNGGIPGIFGAIIFTLINVLKMVLKTVFYTGNVKFDFTNNRKGTIRSAVFLITFTIVHALGNFVDMLGGPNELLGEGWLFDRIHWTGAFGFLPDFPFSVVEEYLALAILLHVAVALKRSWDISINYTIASGRWNMLLSGLVILFFLTKHLQDFRFYPYYDYALIYPPKYFIAFDGLMSGRVFYELPSSGVEPVKVRDLYTREVQLFKDLGTVLLYTSCVLLFITHICLGWKKLIPADAMQIPRDHQQTVIYLGWIAAICVGGMYVSVPWYVYFATPQVVQHV